MKHVCSLLLAGVFALIVILPVAPAYADIDVYEFSSDENRERYRGLTRELRCPKCQNQDIADSNAPIAQDMRREVHRMVESGQSNAEVVDFMVERFGEFVTYRPKVMPETYLLWYGPWVLVAVGLVAIVAVARSRRQSREKTEPRVELSEEKHARVEALLKQYGEDAGKASENTRHEPDSKQEQK